MNNLTDESEVLADGSAAVQPAPVSIPEGQRERELLKRQHAVVAMGRRAIAPPDISILMQDAAALLAETLGTEYSGAAEFTADRQLLRLRLVPRQTDALEPPSQTHETSPFGSESLAGYVLQVARPVVVADLHEGKQFTDAFLRKQGIQSAIAVPLRLLGESFGSLAVYSKTNRRFNDEDVLFVETIAHLVTTTAARRQAESALAAERRLAAGVLQTVDALVLLLDPQGLIIRINPACERITGFSLKEVEGRAVWTVFCTPQESGDFRALLAGLRKDSTPFQLESYLLTKHSQRRVVSWSCSAVTLGGKKVESIIATGVDITGQREAEEKAARAIQVAEEARQALAEQTAAESDQPDRTASRSGFDPQPAVAAFGRLPVGTFGERRRHPRRSYPYRQMVAPVIDGELPDQDEFWEVRCDDISGGGFSFLFPTPPSFDTLVVALGIPPKITYLMAQVAYVIRVESDRDRVFRIGCTYAGRADY